MNYSHTVKARFLDRPNRFVAHVELDGQTETVHVKNTGRCRELLVPGYEVILEEGQNLARKTRYDLISVCKEGRWINMDSQAPNKAAEEWLLKGGFFRRIFLCTEKGNTEIPGLTFILSLLCEKPLWKLKE